MEDTNNKCKMNLGDSEKLLTHPNGARPKTRIKTCLNPVNTPNELRTEGEVYKVYTRQNGCDSGFNSESDKTCSRKTASLNTNSQKEIHNSQFDSGLIDSSYQSSSHPISGQELPQSRNEERIEQKDHSGMSDYFEENESKSYQLPDLPQDTSLESHELKSPLKTTSVHVQGDISTIDDVCKGLNDFKSPQPCTDPDDSDQSFITQLEKDTKSREERCEMNEKNLQSRQLSELGVPSADDGLNEFEQRMIRRTGGPVSLNDYVDYGEPDVPHEPIAPPILFAPPPVEGIQFHFQPVPFHQLLLIGLDAPFWNTRQKG